MLFLLSELSCIIIIICVTFAGHSKIYADDGSKVIGETTSGCPSPSLKLNVSMGYVETDFSKNGTKVKIEVRQKLLDAEVTKMPFVQSNYYIPK